MPIIPAWHPNGLHQLQIDTDRLQYAPGYPSLLGPDASRLQLNVWIGDDIPEAHLEAALVGDLVNHLVSPISHEPCRHEVLTAEYAYVTAPHPAYELHQPLYVWRVVRHRDEKIVYDSLHAKEDRRVVGSGQPLDWNRVLRELQAVGELTRPQPRPRSFW